MKYLLIAAMCGACATTTSDEPEFMMVSFDVPEAVSIPWRISGPVQGDGYVEYLWQLGDENVSIGSGGSYQLPDMGTPIAIQVGLDLEVEWGPLGECDLDGDYHTPNVRFRLLGSWWPEKHDGRWWPEPWEVGQPGDTLWEIDLLLDGQQFGWLRERAPIAYALADDSRPPRSLFDGIFDRAGTSGGSNIVTKPKGDLVWGDKQRAPALEAVVFDTYGQACTVANVVGHVAAGYHGHAILHGGFRCYYAEE